MSKTLTLLKMIYICSRFKAKTKKERKNFFGYTRNVCREVALSGHTLMAPHMMYPLFLDDSVEAEREVGLKAGIDLLGVCDTILVNTRYGISEGMRAEIKRAEELGMKILYADSVSAVERLMEK